MTRKNRRIISDIYSDKSRNLNIKTPPKSEPLLRLAKRPLFRLGGLVKGGLTVLISVLIVFTVVKASTVKITPPSGAPVATGYSLSEIYNFISSNTPATEGSPALDWSAPLQDTGRTLTEIYNALANLISADKVKEGTTYLGVTGTLIPSGGTATTGNVLSGATFYGASQTNWTPQNGSMANNGAFGLKASSSNQSIIPGYYSGGTLTGDTNLTSGNIKNGVSIFGVPGSPKVLDTTSGTAANGDLLSGKIAFANGAQINGSMANKVGSATIITPSTADQAIAQGYYGGVVGDGKVSGDANLVSINIKNGVSIFGVPGSPKVLDTTSGTAANGDLLSGKIAFANGSQINGSMANIGQQKINPGTASTTITAGYHNGTGYCNGDANLVGTNIKSGVSIFGVPGNLVAGYLYGSSSASQVLTSAGAGAGTYNATNLSVGTVKSGTTFGVSLTGQYPSVTYPLPGAVPATDLAASGGNITSANGSVEWYKSDGTQQTATLNFPALASVCINATSNNSSGTLNPSPISIGAGNTICGVPGTLLRNEYNGSAESKVANYTWYPLITSVPGFLGGVDDFDNNQLNGSLGDIPEGSYTGAAWTAACHSGTSPDDSGNNWCGTGEPGAYRKDTNTGLVWSNLATSTSKTWFWANNCYEPGTATYNPGGCTSGDLTGCGCVKKSTSIVIGTTVGCESLDDGLWRTPTQKELMQAYIDGSWGNLSSADSYFWSATTFSNNTYYGWVVYLYSGYTLPTNKPNTNKVRCVR
jgi:hypothetical protein